MPELNSRENDFLNKVKGIIEENISNEQFGVSELAREIGMSRSNLLRRIKKLSNLSVSQFINQVRLKDAMELLREQTLTVSEVSYRVGFNSTSYFIKCFREFYGYSPGEVGKRDLPDPGAGQVQRSWDRRLLMAAGALVLLIAAAILFTVVRPAASAEPGLEKSIAVLPFKNDSNDSANIYIINGLMESILENLQKIEDLRVISRTSVEKYRSSSKTSPEIARELHANYLVEGSGQKIGDQILLNIQLIEAPSDKHLLAKRYKREAVDIFELQQEVARSIANEIEAIITPEEAEQIEKIPTENLEAYDLYLKAMESFRQDTRKGLEGAIPLFEDAIELDPDFALAYADIAISYALLDLYQVEKKHSEEIDFYADKAMLLDPKLAQSLIAKAMYHNNREEYELALPYLEKALEYHPNSSMVINILADFYTRYVPDTEKYLEYALKGVELDIASHDSAESSIIYLHLGNALMQTGFVSEAEKYIDISLQYNPQNLYSELLKAYILLAEGADLSQTKKRLMVLLRKDTSRIDVLKELGVVCYFMHAYDSAYVYYHRMWEITQAQGLDLYDGEKAKMGLILSRLGKEVESRRYFREYLEFAENDQSVYKHLSLAAYYSYMGDSVKAIEHMELFSHQEKYPYWYILFLGMDDPLFEPVKELPEFQQILSTIKVKFWRYHEQIKESLMEKGLL
jgi:TolB-like protein/AraC-like DNA-binding protein/Tfp pilus assembly protein PilF